MNQTKNSSTRRISVKLFAGLLFLLIISAALAGPAAAQTDGGDSDSDQGAFCSVPLASGAVNFFGQFIMQASVATLILSWMASNFGSSIPLVGSQLKQAMKKQEVQSMVGGAKVLFVPGIILTVFNQIGVVVPECLNIIPYL